MRMRMCACVYAHEEKPLKIGFKIGFLKKVKNLFLKNLELSKKNYIFAINNKP